MYDDETMLSSEPITMYDIDWITVWLSGFIYSFIYRTTLVHEVVDGHEVTVDVGCFVGL
jgi:uncharacterized protein (DUF779 family)